MMDDYTKALIDAGFKEDKYNTYLERKDYISAANYFNSFRGVVQEYRPNEIGEFDKNIRDLTRSGRIREAQLNRVKNLNDDRKTDVYLFKEALDSGDVLPNNEITTKHNFYLKNLYTDAVGQGLNSDYGDTSSIKAYQRSKSSPQLLNNDIKPKNKNINVLFDSKKKFNNFLVNSGLNNEDTLRDIGINPIYTKEGTVKMSFTPGNSNLKNIILGLDAGLGLFDDDFDLTDDNFEHNILGNYENSIRQLAKIYSNVDEEYDELINTDLNYTSTSVVSAFMGAKHAKLYDYYARNLIDEDSYKKWQDIYKKDYDALVYGHSYANSEMYMYTDLDEGEVLNSITDSNERVQLGEVIKYAIDKGRASYNAANVNGVNGTMITILPVIDEDGNTKYSDYESDNPNYNRPYKFFIPNLFNDDEEAALNYDTKTRAQLEMTYMMNYGYAYPLAQGGDINPIGNDEFEYIDSNNVIHRVDKTEAFNQINLSMAIDDGLNNIQSDIQAYNNNDTDFTRDEDSYNQLSPRDQELDNKTYALAISIAQEYTSSDNPNIIEPMAKSIYTLLLNKSGLNHIKTIK